MGTETDRDWLRRQRKALARRSETWTKGGTGEGLLTSALLLPVYLRPEDYRSQSALLPHRRAPVDAAGLNFHLGWARCTLGCVVLQGSRAIPEILLSPPACSQSFLRGSAVYPPGPE